MLHLSPLARAAADGDAQAVVQLLANGASVGYMNPSEDGMTALCVACEFGHAEVVAVLLAANADANQARSDGVTPLVLACQEGHAEVAAALLAANAEVDQVDSDGLTPLVLACQEGHTKVVATLLASNADVNLADSDGDTPLFTACWEGHVEVVAALLAANADVERAVAHGFTPLFAASKLGHTEIVAMLFAANATVDPSNENEQTPMDVACKEGHLGVVQLLSSYGASRTFTYTWGRKEDTAENLAAHHGHHNIAAWLRATRLWSTPLHHLEFLTPERALALLRAGQWFKRLPSDFPIPFELWETFVVPQAVGRDYKPPPPQ